MSSPYTHYLRCDECGVDAGKACRDLDDREALEVCDGRRLHVDDRADKIDANRKRAKRRAAQSLPVSTTSEAKRHRRRNGREPQTGPCQSCGVPTRLLGQAVVTGRTWCQAPACRTAMATGKKRRQRAARTVSCAHCGGPAVRGRHATLPDTYCDAVACREAHRAVVARLAREALYAGYVTHAADCACCGGPMPIPRPRDRIYCSQPCQVEASRQAARAQRERLAGVPTNAPVTCRWCDRVVPRGTRHPDARWPTCGGLPCVRARHREITRERRARLAGAVICDQQDHA